MNMLTKQQILLLHTQLIRQSGGTDGVRDEGMLDSAISQPLQTFDNMELYPGIVNKAVRLGYGLITNHPFVDGNKRVSTHAMLVTKVQLFVRTPFLVLLVYNIQISFAYSYSRLYFSHSLRSVSLPRISFIISG